MLADPSILLLDDCTSTVDMATETSILKALGERSHRYTRLIVAQRIGTALEADLILVLEGGRLVAQGTHAELMETSEIYQEIVRSQQDRKEAPGVH